MKKILITLATLFLAAGITFAQGMKEATEIAQAANAALQAGEHQNAIDGFQKALGIAEGLTLENAEENAQRVALIDQCKGVIPTIYMSLAKKQTNDGSFDEALATLELVKSEGAKYGAAESLIKEAEDLVPDILMAKGNTLFNNGSFKDAAAAFKAVVGMQAENGEAVFNMANALSKVGDLSGAIAGFKKAGELGYKKELADSQINTLNLKSAKSAYEKGQFATAVSGAMSCIESAGDNESTKKAAIGIIGGCIQKAAVTNKRPDEAAKYFAQLQKIDPQNANLGSYAFYIGYVYYQNKNNAQAKVWLSKAVKDPKNGANAQKILATIK